MVNVIHINAANGRVTMFRENVDPARFASMPDVIIDPDLSAVKDVPQHYWMLAADGKSVREMNAKEKATWQAEADAAEAIDSGPELSDEMKAIAEVLKVDHAAIRAKMREMKRGKK